ncbi:MAG: DNA-binding protein, partial [Verrucomicrobia bacterium]|nr:DNA-binding protein [Verrucomicrobiota bacterium]
FTPYSSSHTQSQCGTITALPQIRARCVTDIPAVEVNADARGLARELMESGPMPNEYPEDSLHIAICAVNGIDYLVTWNCAHLANAIMRRQVDRFLEMAGYQAPVICTPEELMEE